MQVTEIEDGFHIQKDRQSEAISVSYKVGLRYWKPYGHLLAIYTILSHTTELNKDICSLIVRIGFERALGKLLEQPDGIYTWNASIRELRFHKLYYAYTGTMVIYREKPLFVPHQLFHHSNKWHTIRNAERVYLKRLQLATERHRTFFRLFRLLVVARLVYAMYNTMASQELINMCDHLSKDSELSCSNLSVRLLVVLVMQILFPPFPVTLDILFYVVLSWLITAKCVFSVQETLASFFVLLQRFTKPIVLSTVFFHIGLLIALCLYGSG